MKKFLVAAALLLAITGIGFAQTPAQKPADKPATHKSHKHHAEKKEKTEKKEPKQGN
ncbi:hypothetical protein [Flavihumibacter petaseus]|uniref:Uncharacterized protein n=1 Tax=Flavihumibacter petaseus NBRC 106054 TaxID=1220578 RepID=A0A0E9MW40_9BACT|nr:hypothetical protein [Flavihumibacter petaseus]GAO41641.1 hypothetical protein FPE01S_01_06550 [Flavihumibacter petaseus NBRC 106054]